MKEIYLRIKLSHRHDSPGCLDPINPKIERNSTHFTFQAYCHKDDESIVKYYTCFSLFAGTNVTKTCDLITESVGRYQVIIPKGQEGFYWDQLQGYEQPKIPGLKHWLEMKEILNDTHKYIWEDEVDVIII